VSLEVVFFICFQNLNKILISYSINESGTFSWLFAEIRTESKKLNNVK